MCGIAGILAFDAHAAVDGVRIQRMCETLRHRGPDDCGLTHMGQVCFGHQRLSIIDIASGHQPMTTPERNVCITYNGEIYNFRELRSRLAKLGCNFITHSDTEVILKAYEVYGEECVLHLRGMFAFAIWDRPRGRLFMARDRLGIKPLYYAVTAQELLFGSEIKALLAAGMRPAINKAVLPELLATRFVAGAETLFRGIHKLLPGHTLTWTSKDGLQVRRYWHLPANLDRSSAGLEERAREVRAGLEEAVRIHLVSDVPLGLFLSGGIDSTGIAALMAPMMRGPLQTFAVGIDEPGYNELDYARLAAKSVGAEHREIMVSGAEFFRALPRLIWHEDEPIAFPSSICLNFVSRLAREHVKVVMTGEGADELFLGYNRYRVTAWNERFERPYRAVVPSRMRSSISGMVSRLPRALRRYAERSFIALPPGMRGLFYENFAVFSQSFQHGMLRSVEPERDPYAEGLRYFAEAPGGVLERMSYADMQTYMVELLMKQDQMSMAASIESRVPFLDHKFVEQMAAMPARYKLHGGRTKAVLREALRDLVPPEILTRKKMGFPVPVGRWLRGAFAPLLYDLVLGKRALQRELFDAAYLKVLVEEHLSGVRDHGDRLWMLMNLEIWQRIFLDEESPETVMDKSMPWWVWAQPAANLASAQPVLG